MTNTLLFTELKSYCATPMEKSSRLIAITTSSACSKTKTTTPPIITTTVFLFSRTSPLENTPLPYMLKGTKIIHRQSPSLPTPPPIHRYFWNQDKAQNPTSTWTSSGCSTAVSSLVAMCQAMKSCGQPSNPITTPITVSTVQIKPLKM